MDEFSSKTACVTTRKMKISEKFLRSSFATLTIYVQLYSPVFEFSPTPVFDVGKTFDYNLHFYNRSYRLKSFGTVVDH